MRADGGGGGGGVTGMGGGNGGPGMGVASGPGVEDVVCIGTERVTSGRMND